MPLPVGLDACLTLMTQLLGDTGSTMGFDANEALSKALMWALTARREILYPEGRRPKRDADVARRQPAALSAPRSDPAPAAPTAEEVAAKAAKKAAKNNKKNKARRTRRQRKQAAKNSVEGGQGIIAPPSTDYIDWTSTPRSLAGPLSAELARDRSPRPVNPLLPLASQPLPGAQAPSSATVQAVQESDDGIWERYTTALEISRKRAMSQSPSPGKQ